MFYARCNPGDDKLAPAILETARDRRAGSKSENSN